MGQGRSRLGGQTKAHTKPKGLRDMDSIPYILNHSEADPFGVVGVLLIDRDKDGIPDEWEKEEKK